MVARLTKINGILTHVLVASHFALVKMRSGWDDCLSSVSELLVRLGDMVGEGVGFRRWSGSCFVHRRFHFQLFRLLSVHVLLRAVIQDALYAECGVARDGACEAIKFDALYLALAFHFHERNCHRILIYLECHVCFRPRQTGRKWWLSSPIWKGAVPKLFAPLWSCPWRCLPTSHKYTSVFNKDSFKVILSLSALAESPGFFNVNTSWFQPMRTRSLSRIPNKITYLKNNDTPDKFVSRLVPKTLFGIWKREVDFLKVGVVSGRCGRRVAAFRGRIFVVLRLRRYGRCLWRVRQKPRVDCKGHCLSKWTLHEMEWCFSMRIRCNNLSIAAIDSLPALWSLSPVRRLILVKLRAMIVCFVWSFQNADQSWSPWTGV